MNWWVLRRRPHISWMIASLCIGVLAGVYLAKHIQVGIFSSTAFLMAATLIIGICLWRRYIYLIPALIVGGMAVGLWRGTVQNNDLIMLKSLYGFEITILGRVTEDVDSNTDGMLTIRLDDLKINNQPLPGALWVTAGSGSDVKRNDTLKVKGKLSGGFGSFAGAVYKAQILQIQRQQPGDVALTLRDGFSDSVRKAIPDPEASLGIGYLVGQKRTLPQSLIEALKIAGLTHIVVASGYNLTILVRMARRLFEKISKYLAALTSALMITGFIAVTGLSPSMTRAGLVAGLSLAAWYYGRRFHPLVLLPLAATITVLIKPSYIWGDLGWQLSFAAFAGVMILAPLLQNYFFGDEKPSFVRQILGETVSALIMTAPILISAFGQISNVSIIANLLILPLVPLAMLLTFIAGLGALALPTLAGIIGLPASWLLSYMIKVAEYLSNLQWAVSEVAISGIGASVCYLTIIGTCVYLWRATKYDLRDANLVE